MWFGIVSLFPDMFEVARVGGVLGRAIADGGVEIDVFNPRVHAGDRHRTVDDRPFGGGPGMVMMVEPLLQAVLSAKTRAAERGVSDCPVIYLSPQGERFDQAHARRLADQPGLILIAGRYEGVDQRALTLAVDAELSLGDYVVSGGELPAMLVIDAVARLLPGTLGNSASALEESHLDGLLDYPQYTRPDLVRGLSVPDVLHGGDHGAVKRWRRKAALKSTWERRPDLLNGRALTAADVALLAEIFADLE